MIPDQRVHISRCPVTDRIVPDTCCQGIITSTIFGLPWARPDRLRARFWRRLPYCSGVQARHSAGVSGAVGRVLVLARTTPSEVAQKLRVPVVPTSTGVPVTTN